MKNPDLLPYDPGVLPVFSAPQRGESITIKVEGLPPFKQIRQSLRNCNNPRYSAFTALRSAGIAAMAGRCWYFGAIQLSLCIFGPRPSQGPSLGDYVGGVFDTLDGSSGRTFTYLPVAYQDDCQVTRSESSWIEQDGEHYYEVSIKFL